MPETSNKAVRLMLLGTVALVACSDDPPPAAPRDVPIAAVANSNVGEVRSAQELALRRIELNVTAAGSFKPGEPITVTVHALANRDAVDAHIDLSLLDDPLEARQSTSRLTARALGRAEGSFTRGSQRTVSTQLVFSVPGYYRVLARASSRPGADEAGAARGDTTILGFSTQVVWILIENKGGRVTAGFDAAILRDTTRTPEWGAYGAFVTPEKRRTNGSPRGATMRSTTATGNFITGNLRAYDYDTGMLIPVVGALVSLQCRVTDGDYQYETTTGPTSASSSATDSTGYFSVEAACPDPTWDFANMTFQLGTPEISVWGQGRDDATAVLATPGDYGDIRVVNDVAVHVFNILKRRAPLAAQRFGRTIGQTLVYVADDNASYGVYYCAVSGPTCPTSNVILLNYTRAWGEDGYFSATHEYGHGYHYNGIEPWASYACTNSKHSWTETENNSCGFVEGFADFFAMWLVGDVLVTDNEYGGDHGLENNFDENYAATNPPSGGDGVRVEAAVAAFLYDLVDNGTEPDGSFNQVGPAESFDNLSVPGSWIADIMAACRPGGTVTKLDGSDQLVYCLEKSPSAYTESRRFSTAWRSYGSVTYDRALPAYDAAAIRRLWKYNMYGVLE